MDIPDSLAHKIEMFRNRGRVMEEGYDLFKTTSWVAVMRGQGISPGGYDPIADSKPSERIAQVLNEMRQSFAGAVSAMPDHDRFIAESCAAEMATA